MDKYAGTTYRQYSGTVIAVPLIYIVRSQPCNYAGLGSIYFRRTKMRTEIYSLQKVKSNLVNMICLQYVEKLLQEGRISEKHAELLAKRYKVNCTEKQK